MELLLPHIRTWFDQKREHLLMFSLADCRLEGWFKGELLVLLGRLEHEGRLTAVEREANITIRGSGRRARVDFRVSLAGASHLCELKALCISQAAGTPRNLHFYFRDDHVGLIKDFRKLDQLEGSYKWLIAFVYPRPNEEEWARAVASLPTDLEHWKSITQPADATDVLFVSLWRAEMSTIT